MLLGLANARELPFKPWKGQVGLFGVDTSKLGKWLPPLKATRR